MEFRSNTPLPLLARQGLRYTVVVGLGFLIDVAVASAAAIMFNQALLVSAAIGFMAGLAFNYTAHSKWAFHESGQPLNLANAMRFSVISITVLCLRLLAVIILNILLPISIHHPAIIFTIAAGFSFVINFFLLRLLVFSPTVIRS